MKLHALNENIVNYGFPLEIEDKDKDFHGHSRGILFARTDTEGNVVDNYMPKCDDPDDALKRLINDSRFTKLKKQLFATVNGKVEETIGYYIPYYVVGHSMFMPTLNYDNIIDDGQHVNYVDVEVIFSYHGWNRYATIHLSSVDIPIFTSLYESFSPMGTAISSDEFIESFGAKPYTEGGPDIRYTLDFYNEIGEKQEVGFFCSADICRYIISARVIGLKWRQKDGDKR